MLLLAHGREHGSACSPHRAEVDVENPIESVVVGRMGGAVTAATDADVVHQHVDATPAVECCTGERVALVAVGDVGDEWFCGPSVRPDRRDRFLGT